MEGDEVDIDQIGCRFTIFLSRFLYPPVVGVAEVTGRAAGSNRRRGG